MRYLAHKERTLKHWVSAPFIMVVVVPLVFLDLIIEIYHHVGFRLYGLPLVERNRYIIVDRHKLSYLTLPQKLSCLYCGYANGGLRYWATIAARTEAYWCGIKHELDEDTVEQEHHKDFAPYGDEEAFKRMYQNS